MSRWQRFTIVGAGLALLAFGVMGAGFSAFTLRVRRISDQLPPPAGASEAVITVSDGATLNAWWFKPSDFAGRCVAVLHGIESSRRSSAPFVPMFSAQGYAVLVPDSRAHGSSGGRFVTYGLLERQDVIAWVDWLRRQGCAQIYGLGESLGAAVLIQASANTPAFRAIVADAAFADLKETGQYRMARKLPLPAFLATPIARLVVFSGMAYARFVYGLDFTEVSPLHSIQKTNTPILLIHGLGDDRTPADNSVRLAAAAHSSCSLWLVPHAGHLKSLATAPEEFRER